MVQEKSNVIATNPKAYVQYHIEETLEAGMVLTGTEIKSLRMQGANLKEGFVEITIKDDKMNCSLCGVYIHAYDHGNIWNHDPLRKRALLIHRRQIYQLQASFMKKGTAIIPIKMYFLRRKAKVLLGLGKGKKNYDKRQDLKKKEADRAIEMALKNTQRYKGG